MRVHSSRSEAESPALRGQAADLCVADRSIRPATAHPLCTTSVGYARRAITVDDGDAAFRAGGERPGGEERARPDAVHHRNRGLSEDQERRAGDVVFVEDGLVGDDDGDATVEERIDRILKLQNQPEEK